MRTNEEQDKSNINEWPNCPKEPKEGLYVQGNIYSQFPFPDQDGNKRLGGLIGSAKHANIPFCQLPFQHFSIDNFIESLNISPDDLHRIAKKIEYCNPKGKNYIKGYIK